VVGPVAQDLSPVTQPVAQLLDPLVQPVTQVLSPVAQAVSPVLQPVIQLLEPILQPVTAPIGPELQPIVAPTDQSPPSASQTPGSAAQPSLPTTPDDQAVARSGLGEDQVSVLPSLAAGPAEAEAVLLPPAIVPLVTFSAQPDDNSVRGAPLSVDDGMGDATASALDSNPSLPGLELDPALARALSGATQIAAGAVPTQTLSGTTPTVDLAGAVPSQIATSTNALASTNPTIPVHDAPLGLAVSSPASVADASALSDPISPRSPSANLGSGETHSPSRVLTLPDHWPGVSWQPSSNQPLDRSPESGSPPASSPPVPPVTFSNGMASSSGSLAGGGSSSAAAALTSVPDPLVTTRSALEHAEALLPASNIPETVTPPR
jgi:uncharacterized protein YggT (Ycf19 family)